MAERRKTKGRARHHATRARGDLVGSRLYGVLSAGGSGTRSRKLGQLIADEAGVYTHMNFFVVEGDALDYAVACLSVWAWISSEFGFQHGLIFMTGMS